MDDHLFLEQLDHIILMHRDAHFGESFDVMIEYYANEEALGIDPEITLERIEYLQRAERQLHLNLASFLTDFEKQKVIDSQQAYARLKQVYTQKDLASIALSDLILSESMEATEELEALNHLGPQVSSSLLQLLCFDKAYDPLYPGYGYAPLKAAKALALFQDPQCIPLIFEMLFFDLIFDEEEVFMVLQTFGSSALDFLTQQINIKPITKVQVLAAYGLSFFKPNPNVTQQALKLLEDSDVLNHRYFALYLLELCSSSRRNLQTLAEKSLPSFLQEEIAFLLKHKTEYAFD